MRGEAEATFWAAIYHQVIHHDETTAVPLLERAQTLADAANDLLAMSYVVRHLGFVDVNAEQFDPAHEKFEESVRLRRQIGFLPGVAAGLVALAELAATMADRPTAQCYLEEASTICSETDSKGAMRWISQVREEHGLTEGDQRPYADRQLRRAGLSEGGRTPVSQYAQAVCPSTRRLKCCVPSTRASTARTGSAR